MNDKLVCRVCLTECVGKIHLFESGSEVKYSDMIKEYIGIHLEPDDNLPDGICEECVKDLKAACNFISNIKSSSMKLNVILAWNLPLLANNLLKKEDAKLENIQIEENFDFKYDSTFQSDDSDSESEISLQVLKKKTSQQNKCEENSVAIRNEYLQSKYVVLKKEMSGLRKDMIKCVTCGILSINKSAFIVHYRKHSGEKPHKCSQCNMRYTQVGTLNSHLKKVHPKVWAEIKSREKKLKQDETIKNRKSSDSQQDPNQNDEKSRLRVTCEICGKSYYHKYALNVHMRVHNIEKQVQCTFCPQRFVQSGDRLIHIRIHHTGEKPFVCHICAKSFASGTNLRVHLLSHSSERKFKCDICHKGMKTKDNLKRHLLVMHSQVKGKVCHICGKAYALTYKLNNHMKIWHTRSGDCDICKKSFKNIESHMKTHSTDKTKADKQFKCHMCHKSFTKQKNLSDHIQKHQDENASFKCSYENCNSAFAKKRVLDFHVLKYHLKQTPYFCQYCNRGFYRRGDLGQHLKTSHVPVTVNTS